MLRSLHEANHWDKLDEHTLNSIWSLTGEGWRNLYLDYVEDQVIRLHSPGYKKLKALFKRTLGINDLAHNWKASRWTPTNYTGKLDDLLTVRNRIAHADLRTDSIRKVQTRDAISLVEQLAEWTFETVRQHVIAIDQQEVFELRDKRSPIGRNGRDT